MPPAALVSNLGAAALVAFALAGCGTFKSNEESQAIVSKRVVGMPAGDFFQEFGTYRRRAENADGSALYRWESAMGPAPPGPHGPDERVCRMDVFADKRGRIESVTILLNDPGRVSNSRCSELFRPK